VDGQFPAGLGAGRAPGDLVPGRLEVGPLTQGVK